jgi:hypothetical protein
LGEEEIINPMVSGPLNQAGNKNPAPRNLLKEEKSMDVENRIIPVVEDDQGEGYKDEVPPELMEQLSKLDEKLRKELFKNIQQKHSRK